MYFRWVSVTSTFQFTNEVVGASNSIRVTGLSKLYIVSNCFDLFKISSSISLWLLKTLKKLGLKKLIFSSSFTANLFVVNFILITLGPQSCPLSPFEISSIFFYASLGLNIMLCASSANFLNHNILEHVATSSASPRTFLSSLSRLLCSVWVLLIWWIKMSCFCCVSSNADLLQSNQPLFSFLLCNEVCFALSRITSLNSA